MIKGLPGLQYCKWGNIYIYMYIYEVKVLSGSKDKQCIIVY